MFKKLNPKFVSFILWPLFSFSFFIVSCVPAVQVKKPEKFRTVFCKELKTRGKTKDPVDVTDKFIKGDGKKVYVFHEFFDLTPRASYATRYEWYDPDGQIIGSFAKTIKPAGSHWKLWAWLSLDHKWNRMSGQWSVKTFVNEDLINEKTFFIADNKAELAMMAAEVSLKKQPAERKISAGGALQPPKDYAQRWAVIIGISQYKDSRIPALRYAALDARAFYDWLISGRGGKYAPSRVKLLVDQSATAKNIKEALFVWLKQALEEDAVLIYFAGHGSPESPDSAQNLFLLPYDTRYGNIATTGFPMWDIETALKRFIKAKKVVVLADACHAAGVGQAFDIARRSGRGLKVNPISAGIQNLSKVGDGVCVISASAENQLSQESRKWGGGHGVFTYFLLQGLEGTADYNQDNRVTLGEIIPYLSEQVRRETRNSQSPTVSGKFDPMLCIGR
ncbi:MAG: caspase family protein [Desulfobacterales bacterium]|jgi:hypothetical protein